jgi:hypothetical protein
VTLRDDDVPEMSTAPVLDDEAIEAIVRGAHPIDVQPELRDLAVFAAEIRATVGPPPRPSYELARIMAGGGRLDGGRRRVERRGAPAPALHLRRRTGVRVPGAGVAAKVALGATAAVALAGVGAAAALPGEAGDAVREAIQTVTPVDFGADDRGPRPPREDDPDTDATPIDDTAETGTDARPGGDAGTGAGEPHEHGDDVSTDATGEGDGGFAVEGDDGPDAATEADLHPPWGPGDPGWLPDDGSRPSDQTREGEDWRDGGDEPAPPATGPWGEYDDEDDRSDWEPDESSEDP